MLDNPYDFYHLDEAAEEYGRLYVAGWTGGERHKLKPPTDPAKRKFWEQTDTISDAETELEWLLKSFPLSPPSGRYGRLILTRAMILASLGMNHFVTSAQADESRREKAERACMAIFSSDPSICVMENVSTLTRERFQDGFWEMSIATKIFRTKKGEYCEFFDRKFCPVVHRPRFLQAARDLDSGNLMGVLPERSQAEVSTTQPESVEPSQTDRRNQEPTPFQRAVHAAIASRHLQKRPGGAVFTAAAKLYPDGHLPDSPATFRKAVMAADKTNLKDVGARTSSWGRWLYELKELAADLEHTGPR